MPYKGQKKRIDPSKEHGFIGDKPSKKAPPKVFIESPVIAKYKHDRNLIWLNDMFISDEVKEQILEIYPI